MSLLISLHSFEALPVEMSCMYLSLFCQEATLEELEDASYDHFNLQLSGVQVLVAAAEQDWNQARMTTARTPFHILTPLQMNLFLHKSISPKDTKLPK